MKVILLGNDKSFQGLVVYTLEHFGFEIETYGFTRAFWNRLKIDLPNIILIDVSIDEDSGFEVLRTLRMHPDYRDIPIILLSFKDSEYERILGLEYGADDYISKPIGMMELVARIRAILKRKSIFQPSGVLKFGTIQLSASENIVLVDSRHVTLKKKEYEILRYLMQNPGRTLTRRQIIDEVWGMDYTGSERTVDVQIKNLRERIGENAARYIKTIRGLGYLFGDKWD